MAVASVASPRLSTNLTFFEAPGTGTADADAAKASSDAANAHTASAVFLMVPPGIATGLAGPYPDPAPAMPCAGETSSAGLRSKNPDGLSQNETVSTGITGHSSGRVT